MCGWSSDSARTIVWRSGRWLSDRRTWQPIPEDEPDEVLLGGQPILTEEEILAMTRQYIAKLKSEHENNEKVQKKLDKYLENFDVKKFMKKNPNMTSPDFYMVMFNETEGLVK